MYSRPARMAAVMPDRKTPEVSDERLAGERLAGKRITVMGLGRFGGGIAVARWLVGQGARVRVTDRDSAESLAGSTAELAGLPIEYRLGEHVDADFTDADLIVA